MYKEHFGLSKNPFQSIAEGEAIFEGPAQTKVIADLKTALTAKDSIAVITGPVGVGKTTIVQRVMEQMGPERLVAILGRTQVGSDELVNLLLAQFGVDSVPTRRSECLKTFNGILNERATAGDRAFIVIEDAERLGAELLEELEALTAADGGACGGANIILMGPQRLDNLIARPTLERVRQRIRLQQTLERFTPTEVEAYLRHRIEAAGGDFNVIFEPGASLMIRRCSGGIPRVINALCETAMTVAADNKVTQVSGKIIFKVAVEVFGMAPGDVPVPQVPNAAVAPKATAPKATAAKAAAPQQAPAPTAKKPAPIAASPAASADKNPDPTVPALTIPSAAKADSEPQQTTTPRAPKPPANVATAKPPVPAAAGNGAAGPAAKPKAEASKLPDQPSPKAQPKFKFADEIVVDRDTKPNLPAQAPIKNDPPELPTPEFDKGIPKTADEKPKAEKAPAPPAAAAASMPTLGDTARVEKLAPEGKKDEADPPAMPAVTPAMPAASKDMPEISLEEPGPPAVRLDPKGDEPVASFAKVDHDMLDAALASLAVHDEEDGPEAKEPAPVGDNAAAAIPEVTLDKSIEAKRAKATVVTDPAVLDQMAAELEKTESLEDMSDKLAETLFGSEELEAISQQIREEATPEEASPVELEEAETTGAPTPPTPEVPKTSAEPAPKPAPAAEPAKAPQPVENIGEGGKPPTAAAPPPEKKGPQLEPIESQFNTSMTATLKTLNKHSTPPSDDDDSDEKSGGLLGRLKDTFKS